MTDEIQEKAEETAKEETGIVTAPEKEPEESEDPETENGGETGEAAEADGSDETAAKIEGLESRIDELIELNRELNTRFLRARADLENYKKRSEREKQESIKFANKKIFLQTLNVLDNFERALAAVIDPEDSFVVGVEMIRKQLQDVLTQNGVEEIDAAGKTFDPYLHEAIAKEPTNQHPENTVIEVFQKGFRFQDTLLRPAKVTVAAAMEEESPSESGEGE